LFEAKGKAELGKKLPKKRFCPFFIKKIALTLEKMLDRIVKMRSNIACHMQCHLAFSKCD
jgi:hypothetical protein